MNRRLFLSALLPLLTSFGCVTATRKTVYVPATNLEPPAKKLIPNVNYVEAGETPEWWNYEVYLNGRKVEHCYLANSVDGYVEVWKMGQKEISYVEKEKLYGTVEIKRKK